MDEIQLLTQISAQLNELNEILKIICFGVFGAFLLNVYKYAKGMIRHDNANIK